MSFTDLGLSAKVLSAIEGAGYENPTEIQKSAIPPALEGRDVLGLAQTGTGKTAAFALPVLNRLEKGRARARMPRSLILEPTRELAAQVAEAIDIYGKSHKVTVALLIGGVSFGDQDRLLDRGADIVIATPGRLLDHFERGKLMLSAIEMLVVDEADRMLDMGFIPDIERIFKLTPFTRQTLFFSATMPDEINRITSTFLHNPVKVEASRPSSTASTIEQKLLSVPSKPAEKRAAFRTLLSNENVANAIVFCNRKRDIGILERSMKKHGFNAASLHGDMDQSARMAALAAFRDGEVTYLVASDVAARGLDIPSVSHVFNFDVPTHAEDYVHRIGRTGRAGREGHAFSLAMPSDGKYVTAIEALIGQSIERMTAGTEVEKPQEETTGQEDGRKRSRTRRLRRADTKKSSKEKSKVADDKKRSSGKQKNASRQKSRNNGEERIIGLGDHVPAFLLRPVKTS